MKSKIVIKRNGGTKEDIERALTEVTRAYKKYGETEGEIVVGQLSLKYRIKIKE